MHRGQFRPSFARGFGSPFHILLEMLLGHIQRPSASRLQADGFAENSMPQPSDDRTVFSRKDDRGSCSQAWSPSLSTVVPPVVGECRCRAAARIWRQEGAHRGSKDHGVDAAPERRSGHLPAGKKLRVARAHGSPAQENQVWRRTPRDRPGSALNRALPRPGTGRFTAGVATISRGR
jgi:hypothetical protein